MSDEVRMQYGMLMPANTIIPTSNNKYLDSDEYTNNGSPDKSRGASKTCPLTDTHRFPLIILSYIKPDWLLVWEQNDDELTLLMLTTGTHSDVFGKTRR